MSAHDHSAAFSRLGTPTAVYHFCACGFVRIDWPSGRSIEWHKPSAEMAAEARRIDDEERADDRAARNVRSMGVKDGRLVVDTDRGKELFSELSVGERLLLAMDAAEADAAKSRMPTNAPKFTAGPWKIGLRSDDDDGSYVDIDGTQHGRDGCVWHAFATVVVRMDGADADREEGVANAHLIAAAPKLYAALEIVSACGAPRKVQVCDEFMAVVADGWRWTHPDGRTWTVLAQCGNEPPPMHPVASGALAEARGEG